MTGQSQCRAVIRAGTRCSRTAKTAGFCSTHFPTSPKSSLLEKAKTAGEVVTTATGVITLIKVAVEVWQSIQFGSGPTMPEAYEYLRNELGSVWGSSRRGKYTPGNYGASSVNWAQALDIYLYAKRQLEGEHKSEEHQAQNAAILSSLTEQFLESMPYDLKQSLYEKLGESE